MADSSPTPRDFRNLWFNARADEAAWVASRIEALLGTEYSERDGTVRGLTPADFAILMRSTRQGESDGSPRHWAFTQALTARNMSYSLEAGGSVFDRSQVAVLRATFELLRNGNPTRPIVRNHFDNIVVPAFPSADFSRLAAIMNDWGRRIHAPSGAGGTRRRVYPQQLVHDLLDVFGIANSNFDQGVMQDLGIFSRMIQDVETVYLSIDSDRRFQDILNFLSNVAEGGYDTGTEDMLRRPDAVTVSTVHKVKGLEYPVVFVVDVEAQRFPGKQHNYGGWVPAQVIGSALGRGAYRSTPNEESRLFYTAITRAERYLYVTGSANLPGGKRIRKPSNFSQRLAHPEIGTDATVLPSGLVPSPPARRVDETVLPTSYSDIRYYLRCPHDYQLRRMFGFSPPIQEMFGFGRTVHAAVCKLHERFSNNAPTPTEAEDIARDIFHLKHIPPSNDPVNRPGGYERGRDSAAQIVGNYARSYRGDFTRRKQIEARFEIPVVQAVISGSIDLILKEDDAGNILNAEVVDFKAMEGGVDPEENKKLHFTELAVQVQLYAKAAREVLGENALTGSVHFLKDGRRVDIPVDDSAVNAAVSNVEWAVGRILAGDFPMRPHPDKCGECDFKSICPKNSQDFATLTQPSPIHIETNPSGRETKEARAFSEFDSSM